jgi:hypothetical protein
MALLAGCSVPEQAWHYKIGERNGVAPSGLEQPTKKPAENAGPWEATVQKVVSFRDLGTDWDGLGARAPSPELLESSVGLAYVMRDRGVDPPQCVIAGINGTVSFEWHDRDGTYTEIEIIRPFFAEVMVIEPGQPAKHWTLPTD